jgi:hypothetical protein
VVCLGWHYNLSNRQAGRLLNLPPPRAPRLFCGFCRRSWATREDGKRREDETLTGRDTRSASGGEGWFRRLVPVGGYALAQTFFLIALLQAFLERGVSRRHGLWWLPIPDFLMFLYVFVPTLLPALVTGVVDGVEGQVSNRVPISSPGCSGGTPTGGLPLGYLPRKRATGLVAP